MSMKPHISATSLLCFIQLMKLCVYIQRKREIVTLINHIHVHPICVNMMYANILYILSMYIILSQIDFDSIDHGVVRNSVLTTQQKVHGYVWLDIQMWIYCVQADAYEIHKES